MPGAAHRHRPVGARTLAQRRRQYDLGRDTAHRQFFNSDAWRRTRLAFLAEHPLCQDCEAAGRLTPATEVHHVAKRADAPERAFDMDNLRALCRSCHSVRTGKGE